MRRQWHIHEGKWVWDRGYSAQKSGQLAHSIFTYSIIYDDYLYSLRRFCMFYRHLTRSVFKVYKWCAERIKLRDVDSYFCNLRRFYILYWKLCKSVIKCTNGPQTASICAMWTAISAIYADFAWVFDTCLKACSRFANGAQSASICAILIIFSCVFNT